MNLYNQLKTHIEQGKNPKTQGKDGLYIIWTSITSNGDLRYSVVRNTSKECEDSLGRIFKTEETINIWEQVQDSVKRPELGVEERIKSIELRLNRLEGKSVEREDKEPTVDEINEFHKPYDTVPDKTEPSTEELERLFNPNTPTEEPNF